jgi:hypothetical protein
VAGGSFTVKDAAVLGHSLDAWSRVHCPDEH